MFMVTVVPLFFINYLFFSRREGLNLIFVLSMLSVSFLSTSKGAAAATILSVVLTQISFKGLFSIKNLLLFVLSSFVIGPLFVMLIKVFGNDLVTGTSVATRSAVIITAIYSSIQHPFGVGYSGLLLVFQNEIEKVADFIYGGFPLDFNFYEINEGYINAVDSSQIGTKSFFFNNLIFFGFPFVIYSFLHIKQFIGRLRDSGRQDLEFISWFVFIALFFYVEGIGLYILPVTLAVVFSELKKIPILPPSS
jgi:hypothetical protein